MFSNFELHFHGIPYFVASLISILIGSLVLIKNHRSPLNRSFFLITFTGFLWLFIYSFFIQSKTTPLAEIALRLSYLLSIPYISPSVYVFSLHFSGKESLKKLIALAYGSAFVVSLMTFIFSSTLWTIVKMPWGYFDMLNKTPAGWAIFLIMTGHFTMYALLSLKHLVQGYLNAKDPQEKIQKKIFLIGFAIGYIGSLDFGITVGLKIFPIGPYAFSIFCLIIAYGILRYQMFDVKLVLKRLSVVLMIYAVISLLTIPLASMAIRRLGTNSENLGKAFLWMSFGIGIILSSGPFIYAYVVKNSVWLRGTMATGLTHELKSPLGILQGTMDVLREQVSSGSIDKHKVSDYLEMAQKNIDRLENTVKGLLNVANIHEEQVTIEKRDNDLTELIQLIINRFQPAAIHKGLLIEYELPESIIMKMDSEKIDQAISNIISNAINFSERGKITIQLTKEIGHANVLVKDEGIGLDPKELTKVFDRFYQVKPNTKGTGIGLTIAKAWVEAHGGKIWMISNGKSTGTSTFIILPL